MTPPLPTYLLICALISVCSEKKNSYLFRLFFYIARVCNCSRKSYICAKAHLDLRIYMVHVPVYHIWSVLCCFTFSLFRNSLGTKKDQQDGCLCGNLGNCGGNINSFPDSFNVPFELCHHCPIKDIHRHGKCTLMFSKFPTTTIFLY